MNHLFCALLATAAVGAEPDAPKPGDVMIEKYLKRLTQETSAKFLDGAKTRAEWEAKLPRLRQEYLDMLGLWPLPEKTPLKATVTGTLERGDVVIEKLHYQSKPGLYVTGNLYRPKASRERRRPEKLPPSSTSAATPTAGDDGKTAFQEHGFWFANNGYVYLIIDTLQLGEVAGGASPASTTSATHVNGRPPRLLRARRRRVLERRSTHRLPGQPPRRGRQSASAITGISGGGGATMWISAADEPIKVAVPVGGAERSRKLRVGNKVINGHCDCMFLINTHGWEWTTIAALIAPRPLLFANSDNDGIFPMDGNRRIIERLRRAYKMYDKPDLVEEYVSVGGHDYRPDLRVVIFKWINKHLKNDTGPVKDADFVLLEQGCRSCTTRGGALICRRIRSTTALTRRLCRAPT